MLQTWILLTQRRVLGARLYVHWSVLAVVAFLAVMSFKDPIHAVVAITSYLGIITIHEFGHAWMARHLGCAVFAIRIGFLHGRCEFEFPHSQSDHVWIAWAGVLAQLAIAVPVLIIATVFAGYDFGYAAPAVAFLGYVNLLVALFNLAPGAGLDGAIAWRAVPLLYGWWHARRATQRTLRNWTRRK